MVISIDCTVIVMHMQLLQGPLSEIYMFCVGDIDLTSMGSLGLKT